MKLALVGDILGVRVLETSLPEYETVACNSGPCPVDDGYESPCGSMSLTCKGECTGTCGVLGVGKMMSPNSSSGSHELIGGETMTDGMFSIVVNCCVR